MNGTSTLTGPSTLNFSGLFDALGITSASAGTGLLHILGTLWSVYVILAYLVTLVFLVLFVYASIRYKELQDAAAEDFKEAEKQYKRMYAGPSMTNERWVELTKHIESANPNDWKLAIIEADILLDDALKKMGYAGASLGERLKSISPQSMDTLDDAWQAHRMRNQIAHAGADFILTHKMANETITRYQRVFEELGVV